MSTPPLPWREKTIYAIELYQHKGHPFYRSRSGARATRFEPRIYFRKIYAIRAAMRSKGVVRAFRLEEVGR